MSTRALSRISPQRVGQVCPARRVPQAAGVIPAPAVGPRHRDTQEPADFPVGVCLGRFGHPRRVQQGQQLALVGLHPFRQLRRHRRHRPDEAALADPALELVLPQAAELREIAPELLRPGVLPELWAGDSITLDQAKAYFDGTKVVQVHRDGFTEPVQVPKAPSDVVETVVGGAVEAGLVWLVSGPASLLGEPIPTGVLSGAAQLRPPPAPIPAPDIVPENLPDAWRDEAATALSIATALTQKTGQILPWKIVRDAISGALQARFIGLADGSAPWPCDFAAAQAVKLQAAGGGTGGDSGGWWR